MSDDYEIKLAEGRYKMIESLLEESLTKTKTEIGFSDMLDKVLLNKYLGIPIFMVLAWALFQFAIESSGVFMAMIEIATVTLG